MLISSLIALIGRYACYRSQLASINQLDERTLRDIGISRGEPATSTWRYAGRRPVSLNDRSHTCSKTKKARVTAGLLHVGLERSVSA